MEAYTPIPAEEVRRSQRGLRGVVVGSVVLLLAVGIGVGTRLQWTSPLDSRNFGTVQTRFGTAGVVCGGDAAPPCGEATGLAFAKCTPALRDYFGGYSGDDQDVRVRELIGKRPPTGHAWTFGCGFAPLVRGEPAHLESN